MITAPLGKNHCSPSLESGGASFSGPWQAEVSARAARDVLIGVSQPRKSKSMSSRKRPTVRPIPQSPCMAQLDGREIEVRRRAERSAPARHPLTNPVAANTFNSMPVGGGAFCFGWSKLVGGESAVKRDREASHLFLSVPDKAGLRLSGELDREIYPSRFDGSYKRTRGVKLSNSDGLSPESGIRGWLVGPLVAATERTENRSQTGNSLRIAKTEVGRVKPAFKSLPLQGGAGSPRVFPRLSPNWIGHQNSSLDCEGSSPSGRATFGVQLPTITKARQMTVNTPEKEAAPQTRCHTLPVIPPSPKRRVSIGTRATHSRPLITPGL